MSIDVEPVGAYGLASYVRVHVLEVGRIQFPKRWFQSVKMSDIVRSLFRGKGGPEDEIPIVAYVVEHDDGHIVIDTGMQHAVASRLRSNRLIRRMVDFRVEPSDEIGPQMRARGLRFEDVRWVLPTHLDMDHAGGVGHFPNAEILVHRSEWDYRTTVVGRARFQSKAWPAWFKPKLYELDPQPYGPFERSLPLTAKADVVFLPTPGHTKDHIGIAIKTDDVTLFFAGDHLINQSWFRATLVSNAQQPQPYQRLANDTTRRIRRFIEGTPTILLPSHDADAAANLAQRQPLKI